MAILENYLGEILALTTAVVWAFAIILFKRSGETVHPIALNLFKNLVAIGLFIPTIYIFGGSLDISAPSRIYLILLISGILGIGIADTLFFIALNNLGAGLTAIVGCINSPLIMIVSFIFLGERFTTLQFMGFAAILSAILTANIERAKLPPGNWKRGIIAMIVANIAIAFSVVMMKPLLADWPLLWTTNLRIVGGVLALMVILVFKSRRSAIIATLKSPGNLKFTLSGTLIGTYFAMILWLSGMKFTQLSTVAVLGQTSNIFVFIFAALILKEKMTPLRILGIFLAVGGAILVSLGG